MNKKRERENAVLLRRANQINDAKAAARKAAAEARKQKKERK